MDDDPIKAFLETSGLTAEDLIRRLTQYQSNAAVVEEVVQVKHEPSSPVHTPAAVTETILISDSDDDEDVPAASRREPERIEIRESDDDEVVENKLEVERSQNHANSHSMESDSNRLKRRLVDDEDAVPKKSRRGSEEREDKFTWRSSELFEGKDLDTFILKNRLDDIFEDSAAWTKPSVSGEVEKSECNSSQGRVSIDLVSNETDKAEASEVDTAERTNKDLDLSRTAQDKKCVILDDVNKTETQVSDEKCTVLDEVNGTTTIRCDPRISELNRPQDAPVVEVIDVDEMSSNDSHAESKQRTTQDADINEKKITEKSRSYEPEEVETTKENEKAKEDEDSSCLDNVLDSLLRFVDDDDRSGERTKGAGEVKVRSCNNVEAADESSSLKLGAVLRDKNVNLDVFEDTRGALQKDIDVGLDECMRVDDNAVQKDEDESAVVETDKGIGVVEGAVHKDTEKSDLSKCLSVDEDVVQKDDDESATVNGKSVGVAQNDANLGSFNLHVPKDPQKIEDLTVGSDSSDLEVFSDTKDNCEDVPGSSKDGKLDARKVEVATVSSDVFGDTKVVPVDPDSLKDATVSSDLDAFGDTKEMCQLDSFGGPLKDKYAKVDAQKVEATTASSNLNVFRGTNDGSEVAPVELNSSQILKDTKVNATKVVEAPVSSVSSVLNDTPVDLDLFKDQVDARKVEDTSLSNSPVDLDLFKDKVDARKVKDTSSSNLDLLRDGKDGSVTTQDSSNDSSSGVDENVPSPRNGVDVFENEYRARLRDPRVLKSELEKYDALCADSENVNFDEFLVVKSEHDFEECEPDMEVIDVDERRKLDASFVKDAEPSTEPDTEVIDEVGKLDASFVKDAEPSARDVELINVDEVECNGKLDVAACRSDDPGVFVESDREEDAGHSAEADGSNEKDCNDEGKDGSKRDLETVAEGLSGRSSPSLSTLELNSDISDVDESHRVEAESSSIEFVDAGGPCDTVDLTLLDEQDEHPASAADKKLPTVGTIRKGVGKRTARIFRPPWLKAEDVDDAVAAPNVSTPQVELRPKPVGPLVDIRTTSIPETHYRRRTKTPERPAEPSLFDIKIVDVKSGADVDLRTAIAQIRNRRRCDDVINEELKGDVITVTKTSDFTKIKGWRRKKLLIKSETDIDMDYGEADNVFASDNLDGFLNRQKNLNISYNVPNLRSSNHSNVDYLDSTVIMHDSSADEKGRFESRRRFTMAENEQVNCINQNAKTDPFKPRTLAEKRKLLSREVKPEPPTSQSLVYYRGKAFKVPSKYEKNITVHGENRTKYRYTYKSVKPHKKTKPSIYTTNLGQAVAIKHKPGPMSKKQILDSGWTAVVKHLPHVRLRVVPEYKTPLHPRAAQFVNFETFDVTTERLEFALGALPGKGAATWFDIPYKNDQKTVLLLKAVAVAPEVKPEPPPVKVEDENVDDVVQTMLGDMIDYVELKEVGDSIVKDDLSYEPQVKEVSPTKPGAKKSARTEVIKGSTKKTNLELKRLNVKIIEVNIEDGADDGVGCTKSHCRLGCVCKSLRAPMFPQDHCGKRQCIFGCVCGFERSRNRRMKFVLPSGTDILSETTVSRLQDEAKKNLAKVEKEFTQTVIHANNQTIVVGEKTDRKRRPLKTPKKYEDYIEPVLGEEDQQQEPTAMPKPIVVELPRKRKLPPPEPAVIPCRVVVQKLDLDHVVPLCLEHSLYDCHCGGRDTYSVRSTTCSARPTPSTTPVTVEGREAGEKVETRKVVREKRDKDWECCSRTKGTPNNIVQRNRTIKYKKTLAMQLRRSVNADVESREFSARWLKEKDSVDAVVKQIELDNAVCKGEPENGKKKRRKMPALIPLKEDAPSPPVQIDDDPFLEPLGTGSLESTKPSRRKQVLMTREQMGEMMKKKALEEKARAAEARKAKWKALAEPQQVLGEAVVPLHSDLNQKVKDLLGNNNDVLRIIPWHLLLQKYVAKTIEIWCCPGFQKFVLTDPNVRLTSAWLNVRRHEIDARTCEMRDLDFFKWIVERRSHDEAQSVFIILQKTSKCWEIRGIVRKSGADQSVLKNSQPQAAEPAPPTTESTPPTPQPTPPTPQPTPPAPLPTPQPTPPSPKPTLPTLPTTTTDEVAQKTQQYVGEVNQLYKQVPQLDVRTAKLKFQLLRSEEHGDYEVRLPSVMGGAKWRMLQVSNFSHLAFKRNSYRIKATDIIAAMKQAQQTSRTAFFSNNYIRKNYTNLMFGVYACSFHLNKVFIGPYGLNEDHDLETLRFVNNVLVNTEVVNKMRNAGAQSNGCWFVQASSKKSHESTTTTTVAPAPSPPSKSAPTSVKTNEADYALLSTLDAATTMFTDTLKSLMTAAHLKMPHNAVPLALKANFDDGFVHAFKYPGHDAIHVYWPGSRLDEPHKLDTKDIALEWVIGHLKNTFITVPNFTISAKFVKVSDFVNNSTCSTLSRTYFDELHIVGPFGAVRMVDVADYLIHPDKEHSPELVDVVKQFCQGSDGLTKTDFLESMLVQTKADVSIELTKSSRLSDEKKDLEKKRNGLLLKVKGLKPFNKTAETTNPVGPSEIICLDSDDETDAAPKTVTPQPKKAVKTPEPSFTKLSEALQTTAADPTGNVKVRSNVVLYKMQGGAQLTRKTYGGPAIAAAPKRPAGKLQTIKSVRPMLPFAEKIDLSHLDPVKVRRLLGSKDLTSGRVLLTGEQLRSLRALSKVKVTATSTAVGETPPNT